MLERIRRLSMQAVISQPPQEARVIQIIQVLRALPPDKVVEVWDLVAFLQDRYAAAQPVDVNDAWSDQDLQDLRKTSLAYAESVLWAEENNHAQAR
jgi:hypothetical protein